MRLSMCQRAARQHRESSRRWGDPASCSSECTNGPPALYADGRACFSWDHLLFQQLSGAKEPGADEVNITLKRRVDVSQTKRLHVIVRVRNSSNNGYRTKIDEYWDITNESAIVSWYDNRQYNYDNGRMSIEASTGLGYASQPDNSNLTRARFRLSNLESAAEPVAITFSYTR